MNIYLTFDVEIWCGGWHDLNRRFPAAFERYVLGRSDAGDYALPATLDLVARHGLRATFFVEPLFAARFGQHWLDVIVGMILDAGQDVQLHLHPEWTDEVTPRIFPGPKVKRQNLFQYTRDEQRVLIAIGIEMLKKAGCETIRAFRAGSFAANRDTYTALADNGISIDSSINTCHHDSGRDLPKELDLRFPLSIDGVFVLPMTVFRDGFGSNRPAQIGSCAFAEMKSALSSALALGNEHFVILSHNFEMLKPGRNEPDGIVVSRFTRLCEFLDRQRETFRCVTFSELTKPSGGTTSSTAMPRASTLATARRHAEQAWRRII